MKLFKNLVIPLKMGIPVVEVLVVVVVVVVVGILQKKHSHRVKTDAVF